MSIKNKTIFTGFAPNLVKTDLKTALSFVLLPWLWSKWQRGGYAEKIEEKLKKFLGAKDAICFDSGRTALYFALKALGIKENDEVLVQSYTCVVVINAIKWLGGNPIFIDVTNDFNMDPADLTKKITDKAKVLIIQHTFGKPAPIDKLMGIAHEHKLFVIEDCAHSLGGRLQGCLLGTFGDIGMLSFGSDKVLSCVRGGALISNDDELISKIRIYQKQLPESQKLKIFQHLMHCILFAVCKPIYHLGVGKCLLAIAKKINLINKIIYQEEKMGLPVIFYPAKFPDALAKMLFLKFDSLQNTIAHQKKIADLYDKKIKNPKITKPEWSEENIWLRYTILTDNPREMHNKAKKQGIILGDWYDTPIAPGQCPNDEKLAQQSVNLPTDINISDRQAERIIKFINAF